MSGRYWERAAVSSSGSTALWQQTQLGILPNGQTLQRAIVGMDAFVSSTSEQFGDAGFVHAWGMYLTPTPGGDDRRPIRDANASSPRWYFWDQLHWDVLVAETIAGSTSYIIRNSEESKRTDTRTNYLNDTGGDLHIYVGVECNASTLGSPTMQIALSLAGLVFYRS